MGRAEALSHFPVRREWRAGRDRLWTGLSLGGSWKVTADRRSQWRWVGSNKSESWGQWQQRFCSHWKAVAAAAVDDELEMCTRVNA